MTGCKAVCIAGEWPSSGDISTYKSEVAGVEAVQNQYVSFSERGKIRRPGLTSTTRNGPHEHLLNSMDLAFACLPGINKVSKKFRLCGLGATKILVRVGTTRFRCGAKTETIVLPTGISNGWKRAECAFSSTIGWFTLTSHYRHKNMNSILKKILMERLVLVIKIRIFWSSRRRTRTLKQSVKEL